MKLAAVVMAIVFAIGIIITFNVIASLDVSTIDSDLQTSTGESGRTDAANATTNLLDNLNTF